MTTTTTQKVQNYKGTNSFINKMKDAVAKYGSLTIGQSAAVEKILNAPVEAKQVELDIISQLTKLPFDNVLLVKLLLLVPTFTPLTFH